MTDDIVKRLREAGECPTPLRAYLARAVVLQAADEIVRLRQSLAEIAENPDEPYAADHARDALKGKE